jgi:hypothetical protein
MKKLITILFAILITITAMAQVNIAWDIDPSFTEKQTYTQGPFTTNYIQTNFVAGTYSKYPTKTNSSLYTVVMTNTVYLSGCRVYWGNNTNTYTNSFFVGKTNFWTVPVTNKTIFACVTTADTNGWESDFSAWVRYPGFDTNVLHMLVSKVFPNRMYLTLMPFPGKNYVLQASTSMINPVWTNLMTYAPGNYVSFTTSNNTPSRFFRTYYH